MEILAVFIILVIIISLFFEASCEANKKDVEEKGVFKGAVIPIILFVLFLIGASIAADVVGPIISILWESIPTILAVGVICLIIWLLYKYWEK